MTEEINIETIFKNMQENPRPSPDIDTEGKTDSPEWSGLTYAADSYDLEEFIDNINDNGLYTVDKVGDKKWFGQGAVGIELLYENVETQTPDETTRIRGFRLSFQCGVQLAMGLIEIVEMYDGEFEVEGRVAINFYNLETGSHDPANDSHGYWQEMYSDVQAVLGVEDDDIDDVITDKTEALVAVNNAGYALENASDELKADKEVVMAAVKNNGHALEHASDELKADKEVVMAAVKKDGAALHSASDELKADKEVVMVAVKNDGGALEDASDELKADKEWIIAAVNESGGALEFASDELKADKEVVMAAVQNWAGALQSASDELKADKEVVMAAVKNDSGALRYAADALKADKEVVMAAVKNDDYNIALEHASDELKADPEILALIDDWMTEE